MYEIIGQHLIVSHITRGSSIRDKSKLKENFKYFFFTKLTRPIGELCSLSLVVVKIMR